MMDRQTSLADFIGMWCQEAVATWGDDWGCISRHIRRRYADLDAQTRARLEDEAAVTLAGADILSDSAAH